MDEYIKVTTVFEWFKKDLVHDLPNWRLVLYGFCRKYNFLQSNFVSERLLAWKYPSTCQTSSFFLFRPSSSLKTLII